MLTLLPGRLTARVFTGFEPFAFYKAGELVGFDIDIIKQFAASIDLPVTFAPSDTFAGIWATPGAGHADLAAAGIARFAERIDPRIAWTDAYFEVMRSILIHRARANELRSMEDFDGKTIAFVRDSTADLDTRARAPAGAVLRAIETQPEGMALLVAGHIDGLAMGVPSNAYNRQMHPQFTLIDVHDFSQPEGLRFALAASNTALMEALNGFIASARRDGLISASARRWMMSSAP